MTSTARRLAVIVWRLCGKQTANVYLPGKYLELCRYTYNDSDAKHTPGNIRSPILRSPPLIPTQLPPRPDAGQTFNLHQKLNRIQPMLQNDPVSMQSSAGRQSNERNNTSAESTCD
ncbi:hypothetical protein DPMN_010646 [Dreissena polymorpha]|uniref:Uncharacterized protein n=1 Tax=Dreissena polymorpha TaxID=45954 RepID=A0A9D4RZ98_DREPO|nr:hypothetical protein DPMN_010646 [Dreissena polymorpha]